MASTPSIHIMLVAKSWAQKPRDVTARLNITFIALIFSHLV